MATVRFLIKSNADPATIQVRFKEGRTIDATCATPYKVQRSHWSSAKQNVKNSSDAQDKDKINYDLIHLRPHILQQFNLDNAEDEVIDSKWLKRTVNAYFNKTVGDQEKDKYFTSYVKYFIDEVAPFQVLPSKKRRDPKTLNRYEYALGKVLRYEHENGVRLRHQDVNADFARDFTSFCEDVLGYTNQNTIWGFLKNIKVFAGHARRQGYPVPEFHPGDFSVPEQETHDTYLNEEEINLIYDLDLSDNPRLDRVRDLFIVGLRTGLRISDFMNIGTLDLTKKTVQVKQKKTGKYVVVPIHPQTRATYLKRDAMPTSISEPKFNMYVKEVCELAGLDELTYGGVLDPDTMRKVYGEYPKYKLITSHTCRRSFATNEFEKGRPVTLIRAITGHRTEKSFMKYIKKTQGEFAEMLADEWEREYGERS